MSGIAAVFDRSGRVDRDGFEAVFDALAHRGHDGADAVADGSVALGHQHFYTTPEEVGEEQPVALDGLRLAFDGRVDNRAEVFEALAAAGDSPDPGTSDAELVLRAYRAWGDAFLDRLVGAFALALWDGPDERLLVARDRTGIRELYYADTGDAVVVASEMGAVLEHPTVSGAINEGFLGEYLSTDFLTQGETFYADVREVLAGSSVEVTGGGAREASYWEVGEADVDPPDDPAEEFLDRLEAAVACRMRGTTVPGVKMSGGLDSTTVACLANRHLDGAAADGELHSFSMVLEGVDFFEDEVERMNAVVEACDLRSHVLVANDHYALQDVALYEEAAREGPLFGPTTQPGRKLYERAAGTGRDVLLTGVAGNVYDGNRLYYLDLLRERRLGTFVRHALSDPMPFRSVVLWFVLAPSSDRVARFAMERYGDGAGPDVPEWLDPDFVERTGLADRLDEPVRTGIDGASHELQFKRYFRNARQFGVANERRIALGAGVELRNPYLDSRLLAYATSLPAGVLWEAGQDKALFRRATEGVLPEVVRTQNAAVHFDPLVEVGIEGERREFVDDLFADSRLVELGVVDEPAYRAHVRQQREEDVGRLAIWRLIATELWLRQRS